MTRQILVGNVPIGGGAPVSIQSMLNTPTTDVEGSLRQLRELAAAGCQIARLAVPDREAAAGFREIVKESPLPLVADIHLITALPLRRRKPVRRRFASTPAISAGRIE